MKSARSGRLRRGKKKLDDEKKAIRMINFGTRLNRLGGGEMRRCVNALVSNLIMNIYAVCFLLPFYMVIAVESIA